MMMQSLMENAVVQRLGWVLLHFLWEGALASLLLASALWALRTGRAQVRYVVSLAAMALLISLPVGTFVVLSRGGVPAASMQASAMPADGGVQNAGPGPKTPTVIAGPPSPPRA